MFPSPKWIQRRRRWNRIPPDADSGFPPGVLAPSELERAFQRERARVDRNDQSFSIVVFRLTARGAGDRARLAEVLVDRVRAYDAVGEVDSNRIAALLPETSGEEAWIFADAAIARLAELDLKVGCDVFTYPHPGQEDEDDDSGDHSPIAGPHLDEPGSGPLDERRSTGTDGQPAAPEPQAQPQSRVQSQLRPVETQPVQSPEALAADRPVRDLAPYFEEPLPLYRRAVDVVVSATALALLSPLLLATAVAVKVTSPGPIIFWQWRAGRGGRPFRFYKFRSMHRDAEDRKKDLSLVNEMDGPIFKIKSDPRITPVGRIIRQLSIDELPQLFNVLKGDMTLVGPRPPVLDEVEGYAAWQKQRLDITGGLTCIWQVSGRSDVSFVDWMRMDVRYRHRRSALLDLKLIGRTFGAVFSGRGAY